MGGRRSRQARRRRHRLRPGPGRGLDRRRCLQPAFQVGPSRRFLAQMDSLVAAVLFAVAIVWAVVIGKSDRALTWMTFAGVASLIGTELGRRIAKALAGGRGLPLPFLIERDCEACNTDTVVSSGVADGEPVLQSRGADEARMGHRLRALRRLLANGDDTVQVFRIMRALNGDTSHRNYRRLIASRRAAGSPMRGSSSRLGSATAPGSTPSRRAASAPPIAPSSTAPAIRPTASSRSASPIPASRATSSIPMPGSAGASATSTTSGTC